MRQTTHAQNFVANDELLPPTLKIFAQRTRLLEATRNARCSQRVWSIIGALCRYYLSRTVPDTPATRRGSSPWLPSVILHVMSKHYSKLYIHDFHKDWPRAYKHGGRVAPRCSLHCALAVWRGSITVCTVVVIPRTKSKQKSALKQDTSKPHSLLVVSINGVLWRASTNIWTTKVTFHLQYTSKHN